MPFTYYITEQGIKWYGINLKLLRLVRKNEEKCTFSYIFTIIRKFTEIQNFPFISSNIPAASAYGVYISQLIQYSRACGSYQDFLDSVFLLTMKLLNQGLLLVKLKSSLQKLSGRHHDLVDRYGISVSQMTTDMFHLS